MRLTWPNPVRSPLDAHSAYRASLYRAAITRTISESDRRSATSLDGTYRRFGAARWSRNSPLRDLRCGYAPWHHPAVRRDLLCGLFRLLWPLAPRERQRSQGRDRLRYQFVGSSRPPFPPTYGEPSNAFL